MAPGSCICTGSAENRIRLMDGKREQTGRGRVRRIRDRIEQSARRSQFHPLPDGAVCLIPAERRSISIIRRPGKRDCDVALPVWISEHPLASSHSPDAKSLAVEGMNRSGDSVVVATVDIETGRFTRIGVFVGSDPQQVTWLEDGSTMSVFREPQGAWAFYRFRPGRPAERLGALPHSARISAYRTTAGMWRCSATATRTTFT